MMYARSLLLLWMFLIRLSNAKTRPECILKDGEERNACVYEDARSYLKALESTKPWDGDKPGIQPDTLGDTERLLENYRITQCIPGDTFPSGREPPACQCQTLGGGACFLTGKLDFCGLTFFLPTDKAWEDAALHVTYAILGKKGKYRIEAKTWEKPILEKHMHQIQLPKLTKENAKLWLPVLRRTGNVEIPLPKIVSGTKEVPVPKLYLEELEFTLPELILGQKFVPLPKVGISYKPLWLPTAEIVLKDVSVPELVLTYMNMDVLNLIEKQDVKLPKLVREFEDVPVPKLITAFMKITKKRLGIESHVDIDIPVLEKAYRKIPIKKLVLSGFRTETIKKLAFAGKLFVTLPKLALVGKKEFPVIHFDRQHQVLSIGKPTLEWLEVAIPKLVQTGWKTARVPHLEFKEGQIELPKKVYMEKGVSLPMFVKDLVTKDISAIKPGVSNFTLYKLAMQEKEVAVPKLKLFGYRDVSIYDFDFETIDLSFGKILKFGLAEVSIPHKMLEGYAEVHIPIPGVEFQTIELHDGKKIHVPVKVIKSGPAIKVPVFSVEFVTKKIPVLRLVDSEHSLQLKGIIPVFSRNEIQVPDIALGHEFIDMKKLGYEEKEIPYLTPDNAEWVPVKEVPVVAKNWEAGKDVTIRVFRGWTPEEKTVKMIKQGFQEVEVPTIGMDFKTMILPYFDTSYKDLVVKTKDMDFKYIEVPDIGFQDGKRIVIPQYLWKDKKLLIPEYDFVSKDKLAKNYYLNSTGKGIKVHKFDLETGKTAVIPVHLISTRNKTVGVYRLRPGKTVFLPTWETWKVPVVGIKKRNAKRPKLDLGMKSITIPFLDIKPSDISVPVPYLVYGEEREFVVPHVQLGTDVKQVPYWEVGLSNVTLKLDKYELKNDLPVTVPIIRKSKETWSINLPWISEGPDLKRVTTIAKVPKCIDRKHTDLCITVDDLLEDEDFVKFLTQYLLIPSPLATDQLVDSFLYTTLNLKGEVSNLRGFKEKEFIYVRFVEYWEQQGFLSNRARLMTVAGDVLCENTGKVIVPNILPCQPKNGNLMTIPNHVAHVIDKAVLPLHLFPTVRDLVCDSDSFPDLSIYCKAYSTPGVGVPNKNGDPGCMQQNWMETHPIFMPYVIFAPVDIAWEQFVQVLSAAALKYKSKAETFNQILKSKGKNLDEFLQSLEEYREASGWEAVGHKEAHEISEGMKDWFQYWDPDSTRDFMKIVDKHDKYEVDLATLSVDSFLSSESLICDVLQYNSIVRVGKEGKDLNDLSSTGPGVVKKCELDSGVYITALLTSHADELDCGDGRKGALCRFKIKLSNRHVTERLCGEPLKPRHLVGRTVVSGRINSADVLVPSLQAGVFPKGKLEDIPPFFNLGSGGLLGQVVDITDAVLIPPTLAFSLTLYDIVCDPLQAYLSIFCSFVQVSANLKQNFLEYYKNQALYIDGKGVEDQNGGNGFTVFAIPNEGILEVMAMLPSIPDTVDALIESAVRGGKDAERFILDVLGFHTIQGVFYPWELHDSETLVTTSGGGRSFSEIVVRIQGQKLPLYSRTIRLVSECNYVTVVAPPPAYFPVAINGIVGIVDRALIPPKLCPSACQILEMNPLTNFYIASIYALDLYRDICDATRSGCLRRKTLLAPTDEAWMTAISRLNISRNQLFEDYSELLYDTVMMSVIPNEQYVTDFRARSADIIFTNQGKLQTVLGGYSLDADLISLREDAQREVMGWMVSRVFIQDCRPPGCKSPEAPEGCSAFGYPPALIVLPNLLAADGAVQVIDRVLFPCTPFFCFPPTFTYTPQECTDLPCTPTSPILQTAETSIKATVTYTPDPSCNINCFDWYCNPCSPLKAQTIVAIGGFRPRNPLKVALSEKIKFGLRGWDEFMPERLFFQPENEIRAALVVYINQLGELRFGTQPYFDIEFFEQEHGIDIVPGPSIVADGFLAQPGQTFTVLATYSASCRLAKLYVNGILRGAASVNWLAAVDFTYPVTVGGGSVNTDNVADPVPDPRDLREYKGQESHVLRGNEDLDQRKRLGLRRGRETREEDDLARNAALQAHFESVIDLETDEDFLHDRDSPNGFPNLGHCSQGELSKQGQCLASYWSPEEERVHEHAASRFASDVTDAMPVCSYEETQSSSRNTSNCRRKLERNGIHVSSITRQRQSSMQATSSGSTTSSTEKVQPPGITIGGPDALALRQLTEDLSIFNSTDALAELVEKLKGLSVGELELYLRKVASRNPVYSLFDGYSGWDLDPSSTRPEFLKELKWWAFCGPKYDQYTLAPKGAWGGSQNYPYATCGVSAVVYGTFLGHIECLQIFDGLILYPSTAECPCAT